MRGNIIPLSAVTRCWNKCGLAQLETPTQTTPDWETRAESQKPLVPEPFCADDVCGGRTASTPPSPSYRYVHRRGQHPVSMNSSSVAHTDSGGVREFRVAPRAMFSACLSPSSWQRPSRNPDQGSCAKTLHLVRALRGCYTLAVAAATGLVRSCEVVGCPKFFSRQPADRYATLCFLSGDVGTRTIRDSVVAALMLNGPPRGIVFRACGKLINYFLALDSPRPSLKLWLVIPSRLVVPAGVGGTMTHAEPWA